MGLTTSFDEIDQINIRDIHQGKHISKYINSCVDGLQDQLLSESLGAVTLGAELILIVISDTNVSWQLSILWVLFAQETITCVVLVILCYIYQRLSHVAQRVSKILNVQTSYSVRQQIFYCPSIILPLAFIILDLILQHSVRTALNSSM